MRLVDLRPLWLHKNLFVFWCPHCHKSLLSCKNAVMSRREQCDMFALRFGYVSIVPCKPEMAWTFASGTAFETMDVTPSLDASASGHWHGHITAGEIRGGAQVQGIALGSGADIC